MRSNAGSVIVIGGGWAGCAAAVELARQGTQVTLIEAARTLGGRARHLELHGKSLDNGQHILLGAYRETLRMLRLTGVDASQAVLRLPLQICYPPASGLLQFVAPKLPSPLHMLVALWRSRGLNADDKTALLRFFSAARWMGWQQHADCPVIELLTRFDQTDRVVALLWRPLCIAALNTPPERASANVFLNVLRDSLGARRRASDMLLPRANLSALFPESAARFIEQHGGQVFRGMAAERIVPDGDKWRVVVNRQHAALPDAAFDHVIVATQASQAARLLAEQADVAALSSLAYEPITTCYLQYPASVRLPGPFFALLDDPAREEWGQFVFDRGWLDAGNAGILAVVTSASATAIEQPRGALAASIAAQLARAFDFPALRTPEWSEIISEKRATFSCTPGLHRPSVDTGIRGLWLAGDYTAGDYPATIESAVRSGVSVAKSVAAQAD